MLTDFGHECLTKACLALDKWLEGNNARIEGATPSMVAQVVIGGFTDAASETGQVKKPRLLSPVLRQRAVELALGWAADCGGKSIRDVLSAASEIEDWLLRNPETDSNEPPDRSEEDA